MRIELLLPSEPLLLFLSLSSSPAPPRSCHRGSAYTSVLRRDVDRLVPAVDEKIPEVVRRKFWKELIGNLTIFAKSSLLYRHLRLSFSSPNLIVALVALPCISSSIISISIVVRDSLIE